MGADLKQNMYICARFFENIHPRADRLIFLVFVILVPYWATTRKRKPSQNVNRCCKILETLALMSVRMLMEQYMQ